MKGGDSLMTIILEMVIDPMTIFVIWTLVTKGTLPENINEKKP